VERQAVTSQTRGRVSSQRALVRQMTVWPSLQSLLLTPALRVRPSQVLLMLCCLCRPRPLTRPLSPNPVQDPYPDLCRVPALVLRPPTLVLGDFMSRTSSASAVSTYKRTVSQSVFSSFHCHL